MVLDPFFHDFVELKTVCTSWQNKFAIWNEVCSKFWSTTTQPAFQCQGSRRFYPITFAPSEFVPHFFERSTECAPYSVLVYLDVILKFRKIGVFSITSLGSENTISRSLSMNTRVNAGGKLTWQLSANSESWLQTRTVRTGLGIKPPQFSENLWFNLSHVVMSCIAVPLLHYTPLFLTPGWKTTYGH